MVLDKLLSKMGIGILASFIMDSFLGRGNLYGRMALSMKDNLQTIVSRGKGPIHGLMDPIMKVKLRMVLEMAMVSIKLMMPLMKESGNRARSKAREK